MNGSALAEMAVEERHLSLALQEALQPQTETRVGVMDDLTVTGRVTAGSFAGDGSLLTRIPREAIQISKGGIHGSRIEFGSVTLLHLDPELAEAIQMPRAAPPPLESMGTLSVTGLLVAGQFAGSGDGLTNVPFRAIDIPAGAIEGNMISRSTVGFHHLAPDVIDSIAKAHRAAFPDAEGNLTVSNTLSAARFVGDGSGLTDLSLDALFIPNGAIDGAKVSDVRVST